MNPQDLTQVLFTHIAPAIGAIIVALICEHFKRIQNSKSIKVILTVGVSLFTLTGVLIFSMFVWRLAKTEIIITYPVDQIKVSQTEVVRGISRRVNKSNEIWIVIYSQEVGHYYPQNDYVKTETNGNWSSVSYIGIPQDTGKKFDIVAVLADQGTQEVFNNYLSNAKDKNDWSGLINLPNSAKVYHRITVIRE